MKKNATSVSFTIPNIDGTIATMQPEEFSRKQREKLDRLVNAPSTINGWSLLGKTLLGLVIGALMAVVLFVLLGTVGSLMGGTTSSEITGLGAVTYQHELSWLINLFLGFLVSFLGNLLLLISYGFFYSYKYSQIGKTMGLLLLTNAILSIGMAVLFLVFQSIQNAPVVLFVFYVALSLFLSFSQIEFVVNPNYSASALIGNSLGFCFVLIIIGAMLTTSLSTSVNANDPQKLMLLTPLLSFPLMIFGQGLWEIVYAKIYEQGANPFYLPSKAELDTETILENQKEQQKQESVNVEF